MVQRVSSSPIFKNYIKIKCNTKDSERISSFDSEIGDILERFKRGKEEEKEAVLQTIDDFAFNWLANHEKRLLIILGNYGTGKTTFCYKFASDLANTCIDNLKGNRIPVLIPIRDFPRSSSLISLIENALRLNGIDFESFLMLHREGKVLLIIDGFDEFTINVDKKSAIQSFREIQSLLSDKCKVILTSRTHYFRSSDEEKDILSPTDSLIAYFGLETEVKNINNVHDIVYLEKLSDEQINDYIRVTYRKTYNQYLPLLYTIYNLQDLARRPILLDLIARALPELENKSSITSSSELYEIYATRWMEREIWRLDISPDQTLEFMESIALEMLEQGALSVNFKELLPLIKRFFQGDQTLPQKFVDELDQQIRTGTFLNRDSAGNYQFVHRSFFEFFLARKFVKEIFSFNFKAINEHISVMEDSEVIGQFSAELLSMYLLKSPYRKAILQRPVQCGDLVYIPSGECILGDKKYKNFRKEYVASFYIDRYPVTNADYRLFVDSTGYRSPFVPKRFAKWHNWLNGKFPDGKESHPVVLVSWLDAFIFSLWNGKRLPKSLEWEKAARGEKGLLYPWGNTFKIENCNVFEGYEGDTSPVNKFPNGCSSYGCFDMIGNVWEWIDDWQFETPKDDEDFRHYRFLNSRLRLLAGGAWGPNPLSKDCAHREKESIAYKSISIGFRCARDGDLA